MPRLFFALQPGPGQQSAIAAAVLPIVQALGAIPTITGNLHLTLAFMGEVAVEAIPDLLGTAARVRPRPVRLSLAQVDCWDGSRVLCLLPDETAEMVAARQLAQSLGEALRAAGFAPDLKPFRAHVTVARKVPSSACRARRWPERLDAPLPFTADGFVLMESTREAEGQRYRVIHAWPSGPNDS